METAEKTVITVENTINAPVSKVWDYWNKPEHITRWCAANDDWHAPSASNDVRTGGTFATRMEAKDGSFGFDFAGTYTNVVTNSLLEYSFGDRTATVSFSETPSGVNVKIVFDAEETHSIEQQQDGWQAILNNFKRHVETIMRGSFG